MKNHLNKLKNKINSIQLELKKLAKAFHSVNN